MKIAALSDYMHDANVLLVRCGSVGSMVALHLASAGVRHLTLVDKDNVESSNLRRHLATSHHVGQSKVSAVAEQLTSRFGRLRVSTEHFCVLSDPARLRQLIVDAAICLVAVDAEGPKYLIDRTAFYLAKPVVYASVYGGGSGVEIILQWQAQDTPCYGCSANAVGRSGVEIEPAEESSSYAVPSDDGSHLAWRDADLTGIMPAATLAASLTRSILEHQGGNPEPVRAFTGDGANMWQLFTQPSGYLPTWRLEPRLVVPLTDCPQCAASLTQQTRTSGNNAYPS
ncbi:MAG: ThiF family adenylyltransferase [Planctomycetota bacterium]|nr:ThiF family adenylyltransferase [Planctomycetota bacterium]